MTNQEIAKLLREVAASYVIQDDKKYRFQIVAYNNAADSINSETTQIKDLVKENKLDTLAGIGSSIKSHLEELIKTGRVKHFDSIKKSIPEAVFPLLDIPTFGPKKAYKLVTQFHLKNPDTVVQDIKRIAEEGKIASVPGFGEKSQQDILRAVEEFKLGIAKTVRMVLPYAYEIADKMLSYLRSCEDVIQAEPLGSLRRMASTVGDIDIAISTNKPEKVISHFVNYPYKERIIEKGDTSASILVSGGKQIDLMAQPPQRFGSLLQHFTGNKNHNVHLREYALKKGLSLSERGIKRQMANGKLKMENYATEKEFYNALGLDWIPQEIREDTGEIELASVHKLPALVELKDIKGDLHIHSSFPIQPSHDLGQDKIEEMLKVASKLKYEYLGFSEHNPSISKHNSSQIYTIISKRNEYIEQITQSIKSVRIIKLLEIDILTNGELAVDNKSLDLLDGAIVSIHSSFKMGKNELTKRVLQGLSHPKAKILAHPTGRMLNERPGYELDFDKIFDFCVKNNKALEINAWPNRLDLPDTLVREAIKYGVKFVVDTDSHASWQMNLMRYGVAVARRGWAQKDDILNTLSYNQFIKWLRG